MTNPVVTAQDLRKFAQMARYESNRTRAGKLPSEPVPWLSMEEWEHFCAYLEARASEAEAREAARAIRPWESTTNPFAGKYDLTAGTFPKGEPEEGGR